MKVKIEKISVDVDGECLELTPEQARALRDELSKLLGDEPRITITPYVAPWPYRWQYDWPYNTPYYYTACSGGSTAPSLSINATGSNEAGLAAEHFSTGGVAWQ